MPKNIFQLFSKIRNIFTFLCRGIYEEKKFSSHRQVNDRPNGTSKKIRQVLQSKSDNGERVSSTVPYGYKKDTENPKQWLIDEPAAKVVRYIYQLALEGLGVTKIARRLEREEFLTPTAYYASIGRKTRNPFTTSYAWA